MQAIIRLSVASVSAAALAVLPASIALADSVNLTNTGNNVLLLQGLGDSTAISVSNTNVASINQVSSNVSNTGGNTANRNIGNTEIATGQASSSSAMSATTNTNQTAIDLNNPGDDDELTVTNSGDGVEIVGDNGDSTSVGIANTNVANVNQVSFNAANTGGNTANRNIGDTGIDSGDAATGNVMGVQANSNLSQIGNLNVGTGLTLNVTNSGDDLFIGCGQEIQIIDNNSCGDVLEIGVLNSNALNVNQFAMNMAKTGGNTANRNIALDGAVSIDTGNASAANAMSILGNTNATGIGFDQTEDDEDVVEVVNTGNNLVLELGGFSTTTTSILVHNGNMLQGNQSAFNMALTGWNQANRNIADNGDSVTTMTGNGNSANVFNISANANQTGIGVMPSMSLWGLLLSL